MRLLIKNARLIATFDGKMPARESCGSEIEYGDIYIKGKEIIKIGQRLEIDSFKVDKVIDASGKVVLPGFVNTHHHLYQTMTRCVPVAQDDKLFDWLSKLYEIWRYLTPEAVYYSSLAGMGELLLTGCTTTTDQYYIFPQNVSTELIDEQIKAAAEIGLRFHPCRGSMSRGRSQGGLPPDDLVQQEDRILTDSERLIRKYHDPAKFSMCQLALAPCSPFSVTNELLKETAALARKHKVRLHTHIAETKDEEEYCLTIYGKRPLAFLADMDWLGADVWLAHCVYLNDVEISLMAETATGVAHCPTSNMRLGSGVAPVPRMMEKGVSVGLAVDGSASNDSSDMLAEVRQCFLVHRVKWGVETMNARQALWLATRGGAKVLGREDIGSLEPGKAADLIIFDLNKLGYTGSDSNPLAAIVLCGDSHMADTVIVNGEIIVEKGKLIRVDEQQIIEKTNAISRTMINRALKAK